MTSNTDTRTVLAENSFGRPKQMDKAEYTNRAVTDHRCMATTDEEFELASRIFDMQHKLASMCFERLYAEQNK